MRGEHPLSPMLRVRPVLHEPLCHPGLRDDLERFKDDLGFGMIP